MHSNHEYFGALMNLNEYLAKICMHSLLRPLLTIQLIIYLNDVKDALKECRECMVEISNSNTLLLKLNLRLSESSTQKPWYAEVQALAAKDRPLDQYKLALRAHK